MRKAHVSPKSAPTPTSTPRPGATPVNLVDAGTPLPSPSGGSAESVVSFSGAPGPAARPSPIRLSLPAAAITSAFGGSAVSRRGETRE